MLEQFKLTNHHLYLDTLQQWFSNGGDSSQKLHEAQAHVSHYIVSIRTLLMFMLLQ